MRALFITLDAYPVFGTTVGIFKKLFFDGKLAEKIDDISVLTIKRQMEDKDFEIIDNIKIYRASAWCSIPMRGRYSQLKGMERILMPWDKICHRIQSYRYRGRTSFFTEANIRALCREMKKINADSFDYIIPIFGCHDAPAAVLKYKPKHAKVVLYQVDPCSTNWVLDKMDYEKARKFEMNMYRCAAAVLTMPVIYNEVQHFIPEDWKSKFYPIELPLITCPPKFENNKSEDSKIKCVFSGLIYLGIRDPSYTLKLFRSLTESGNVSLHMVGVKKEELPEVYQDMDVVCYGRVSADEAQKVMNEADILVNIGNMMTNQIPSKIFDYASQGKPIVNVCKNANCPTLPYMAKYPLSLNLMEDDSIFDNQLNLLNEFINNVGKERLSFETVEELFESATPKYCANWLYDLLNKI
jgi:hypothetical protein